MGQRIGMRCGCGYATTTTIGAGRNTFKTICSFPHFCKTCGVVDANRFAEVISCKKCGSDDLIMYGEEKTVAETRPFWWPFSKRETTHWSHDARVTMPFGTTHVSWGDLRITDGDHLCPSCLKMTLRLDRRSVMFFD